MHHSRLGIVLYLQLDILRFSQVWILWERLLQDQKDATDYIAYCACMFREESGEGGGKNKQEASRLKTSAVYAW